MLHFLAHLFPFHVDDFVLDVLDQTLPSCTTCIVSNTIQGTNLGCSGQLKDKLKSDAESIATGI